jgi:hypothetical protein
MAGIETITTMMVIIVTIITAIIMAITATIRGVEDITGVEKTIGAGGMIGIDDVSMGCIL